jgi:hypothetical protein
MLTAREAARLGSKHKAAQDKLHDITDVLRDTPATSEIGHLMLELSEEMRQAFNTAMRILER